MGQAEGLRQRHRGQGHLGVRRRPGRLERRCAVADRRFRRAVRPGVAQRRRGRGRGRGRARAHRAPDLVHHLEARVPRRPEGDRRGLPRDHGPALSDHGGGRGHGAGRGSRQDRDRSHRGGAGLGGTMRYALALLIALVCATGAAAQPYPSKPIRIVVGFTPGGTTDILARLVGQAMSESLGTAVVIENRPGASAMIGDDVVAKAAADGYTLGMMASPHATNASLYARVPYDVATDFTSIVLVARTKHILVVGPSVPARSLPELVAWIKAQPGEVSYGSNAGGGRTHLAPQLLARAARA